MARDREDRQFVQEQEEQAEPMGKTIIFHGCFMHLSVTR